MATNKNSLLNSWRGQLDAKFGAWAWDYAYNMLKAWKSINYVKQTLADWSFKKTWTNYTPYYSVTWKTSTQNTNPWWTGRDLSYVQPSSYYWSWIDWNYGADISKDANRAKQMAYNLKSDMESNPNLFKNRADYDQYYKYSSRSDSQKKMLDEFFDNANKYYLWATENLYADMASNASTDKNKKLMAKAADTYNKMLPYLNGIRQKLDDRLWPVFDRLMDSQTKILEDYAYLRKLQMQYNRGMVEEANSRAAWQAASLWSTMSGQWLSQSSIASSMFWAEKAWVSELNDIQEQHIKTMKELADAEWDFTNNWAGVVNNLTQTEQTYLKNWYDSFKTLQDGLDDTYKTMITEKYNPYEELTRAKVTGAAETLQSTGKWDSKQNQYQIGSKAKREQMLYNNLSAVLEWDTLAKIVTHISSAAAQYSDFQKALNAVLSKAVDSKTAAKIVNQIIENPGGNDPDGNDPDGNDPDGDDPFADYDISSNFLNTLTKI